jgi:thiol-disulfide isomerase/thioredoxin
MRFAIALLALSSLAVAQEPGPPPAQAGHPVLAIGASAPDFDLPGVDGKNHKLAEFQSSPILMVIFMCNHCPTSQLYEGRIQRLVDDDRDKGVAAVAIQPNDPSAILLSELGYTDVSDSFEEMKIRAAYRHFNYPYLYDGETQSVSQAYGPVATPHVFIFDKDRKLRYEGRIDDSQREANVKKQDARAALDAMVAGKPVAVPHTPAFGCSTKWKSKIDSQLKEKQKIEAEPVKVEMVDAEGLKKLRANGTDKVLLVNFWATWCGPCLTEMPDILNTWRMFRRRDFDLVTVAANQPDERAGVMRILNQEHSSTRNLLFGSPDTYALQEAFEKSWQGGVPFTMLIAPGGKVLFEQQGEIDVLALRRIILAHLEDETYKSHPNYWAH